MSAERDFAVQHLNRWADELDRQGVDQRAGLLRLVVRQLLEDARPAPAADDRPICAGCGTALEQRPRGRPRRWCSEPCRTRARKRPEMVR
jgi:hypothetical protein